ncbi:MBL fold metallo-hydrolase [Dermatobacter hominis]|uniref:MBL fold metallo-hydrolase n=1 Tax=Dermatobacter hominis TaxID=2884263 RepID=UPI001D105232|nr:MBL fold metallo-hydrolase [Dermatobacter hominis]UDY35120.1 MBL fold metallo-hydrolase [Dermatobacter hominis]
MPAPIELPDLAADPQRADPGDAASGELLFIGTATVLLRFGGFTVLTDPNFLHQGEHAPLGGGLRSRRLTEPAMDVSELPPLDVVVLSHHHGDHFDQRAADGLPKDVPIVTTPHAARKLARQGFTDARPLLTWEHQDLRRGDRALRITATPARHAPGPLNAVMPPVMGSVLEFGDSRDTDLRIYTTGDTLVHDRLHDIPRRYPDLHLALLHLGGTKVLGVMLTMDAAQGVEALRIVRPRHAVPIHFDDYTVFRSPLEDFRRAIDAADDVGTQVHYLDRGETLRFTADDLSR